MLIERLILNDFGTYRGSHSFDLAPRTKYGSKRTIVLFGGLNGAGKTTILKAVRLALYGRQGFDLPLTEKEYAAILAQLIHASPTQLVAADRASVELVFSYARLGETLRYRVQRVWVGKGSSVQESLRLFKNEVDEPWLVDDQAQGFLSQLIPSGISQFFFFDGEQIADLARDDADEVLSDAIRRLLGLDIADRLAADLTSFVRARRAASTPDDVRTKLRSLHEAYDQLISEIDKAQAEMQQALQPQLDQAIAAKERMRSKLSDRGGAWAINRTQVEARLKGIQEDRASRDEQIRELLSGPGVFMFAGELRQHLVSTVLSERKALEAKAISGSIKSSVDQLKKRLVAVKGSSGWRPVVNRSIDEWVREVCAPPEAPSKIIHGLTGSEADKLLNTLTATVPMVEHQLAELQKGLKQLSEQEAQEQDRLAHAPSDESIQEAFRALEESMEVVNRLEARKQEVLQEIRRKLWQAIDITRKKRKLEKDSQVDGITLRADYLAESVQEVLGEFKQRAGHRKCQELRRHFLAAFQRLSRKDDMIADAAIDESTFVVRLLDQQGNEIPKARLSAGEKQIFAISMLEALGKASGRSLPIIIDTPLGRLDSKHREKLVEAYFPRASHQVIVLSTDTEVDQRFYDGLKSSVSHAFHLNFDSVERSTTMEEGYFWKSKEVANVA
ncbi:DNA sulfur modification protein DndD [Variovorax sp. PBL-E5]|uniref:DNA sulfur modification protein DndD n=1 Tax=Variovorax sp. PBL-E5 TaxID=434014 RepID=UPI001317FE04|nr:DNA sulfur modification protein DndD [Variovorax sp. PBL-E5]VTU38535.1 DNA sulfur modification protein DndD [Variovorax sp. PBL-E5]